MTDGMVKCNWMKGWINLQNVLLIAICAQIEGNAQYVCSIIFWRMGHVKYATKTVIYAKQLNKTAFIANQWNTSTLVLTLAKTASPTATSVQIVQIVFNAAVDTFITRQRSFVSDVGSTVRSANQWRNAKYVLKGIISTKRQGIAILAMRLLIIVSFVSIMKVKLL